MGEPMARCPRRGTIGWHEERNASSRESCGRARSPAANSGNRDRHALPCSLCQDSGYRQPRREGRRPGFKGRPGRASACQFAGSPFIRLRHRFFLCHAEGGGRIMPVAFSIRFRLSIRESGQLATAWATPTQPVGGVHADNGEVQAGRMRWASRGCACVTHGTPLTSAVSSCEVCLFV
jgi:hypothetical protein